MNNDRLLNFLGICKRAGKLLSGAETVTKAVNEGKAQLVLYAADVSENSLKGVLRAADANHVTAKRIPQSKEELTHVFLEALGCRSYGTPDPLAVKGQRKSLRYCPSNLFSGVEVSNLEFFAECLLDLSALSSFTEAYLADTIKSKDAYRILKKAVATVICDDEATPLLEQLHKQKTNLIDAINREHHFFLQGRNS